MGFLISIITIALSIFAFSQIFGCLFYKILKQKEFIYVITILIYGIILAGYYLVIKFWFNSYFNYYLYPTIFCFIISFFNVKED